MMTADATAGAKKKRKLHDLAPVFLHSCRQFLWTVDKSLSVMMIAVGKQIRLTVVEKAMRTKVKSQSVWLSDSSTWYN